MSAEEKKNEEVKVQDLDISVVIDVNYALKSLGVEMIFWQMISMFEAT